MYMPKTETQPGTIKTERGTWTPLGTPPDHQAGRATKEQIERMNQAIKEQAEKERKA